MKNFKKIISILLCFSLIFALGSASMNVSAETASEKVERLKREEADAKAILEAITEEVDELDAKINENQSHIDEINSTIDANNALIEKTQADIEEDKETFSKRIRSIYMSNSESRIKILLGAESFSQFLQLAQLTSSVSSYDKQVMENLAEQIKLLEEKNKENEKLKAEYVEKKAELDKQRETKAARQEEARVIFEEKSNLREEAEAEKRAEEEAMARRAQGGGSGGASAPEFAGSGIFGWPSDYNYISAGFASDDDVHNGTHNGIDIAGSGIMGTYIYAIGDGYVTYVANYCTHNYGKWYGCGCGGNYGNYAQIDHGTVNGNHYTATYAHATSIIVSPGQYVSKGQVIGYVGTTGWSTGPHLHLGITQNGYWINPMRVL